LKAWALAAALLLAPLGATAQMLGLGGRNDGQPLQIDADKGIEWHQNERAYVARGNAKATRGDVSVRADTLTAYYRPKPGAADPSQGGSEIYRILAEGHVILASQTQTVTGDRAVYDLDQAVAVVTGKDLKLTTPTDVITARDSLEWYDRTGLAVARGNAVASRADRRVNADVLVAHVERPQGEQSRISRVDAHGGVHVSTPQEVARGRAGVYNLDTGIVTLTGNVTITRGENEIRGETAVVDLNNNVSRMLAGPATGGRVQGLIIPESDKNVGTTPSAPGAKR
jgi:lipopolysaccharide export system protein LptA